MARGAARYLYEEGYPQQSTQDFGAAWHDALPQQHRRLPPLWQWMSEWAHPGEHRRCLLASRAP